MKKIFGLALLGLTLPAFADFAPGPHPVNPVGPNVAVQSMTIEGQDAAELGDSLDGKYEVESMLRTGSTSSKVFYSSTGLTQIVCKKTSGVSGEQNSCEIQKSRNGRPLPRYVRAVRMG